jgi:8-oxo-dGTP pyrophosphatase MutT (NUDIX family)
MYPVRNSAKAIIMHKDRLLLIEKNNGQGSYYLLPGGGQDKDEAITDALKRECREELGAEVEVGRLRYIREYIGKNHEFAATDDLHQVEFMFECELVGEMDESRATNKDEGQTGFAWIALTDGKARVYPKALLERLRAGYEGVYWGDVN